MNNLDLNLIIVSAIGLLGTIVSPIISNWISIQKQTELNKIEIEKIKLQNQLELKKSKYNHEIKEKSEAFSNFIYCAYKWRYSSTSYHEEFNEYLKAYGKLNSYDVSEYTNTCIADINEYIQRGDFLDNGYDNIFENYIKTVREAFLNEIRLAKSQIESNNIQE